MEPRSCAIRHQCSPISPNLTRDMVEWVMERDNRNHYRAPQTFQVSTMPTFLATNVEELLETGIEVSSVANEVEFPDPITMFTLATALSVRPSPSRRGGQDNSCLVTRNRQCDSYYTGFTWDPGLSHNVSIKERSKLENKVYIPRKGYYHWTGLCY